MRAPVRSIALVLLCSVFASACKKGWVEEYVDGMRWLRTRANSKKNGTAEVQIEVLPGETAMLASAEVDEGYQVHFRSLTDPAGQPMFRAFDWTGTDYSKTNAGYVSSVSTLNWPVAEVDPGLVAGSYTAEFGVVDGDLDYVSEPLFIDVLLKADDDFDDGLLAVNIVYTGGLDQDDKLRAAVDVAVDIWRELYGEMGIDVEFSELAYGLAGTEALEPPAFGSAAVYRDISAATDLRSVNVVIAPSIIADDDIFGISGDIPGPLVSTTRSAVLISADLSAGSDGKFSEAEERLLAETMAHEVGHFLGLFHPVETSWDTWDVLDDTSQCSSERQCILDLGTNLMFPFPVCSGFSCTPQGDMSDEQVGVAHRYVGVD